MVTLFWIVLCGSPCLFLWLYLRHREQYQRPVRSRRPAWTELSEDEWFYVMTGYPDKQIWMEDMGYDDTD